MAVKYHLIFSHIAFCHLKSRKPFLGVFMANARVEISVSYVIGHLRYRLRHHTDLGRHNLRHCAIGSAEGRASHIETLNHSQAERLVPHDGEHKPRRLPQQLSLAIASHHAMERDLGRQSETQPHVPTETSSAQHIHLATIGQGLGHTYGAVEVLDFPIGLGKEMVTAVISRVKIRIGVLGVIPVYAVVDKVGAAMACSMVLRDEYGVRAERLIEIAMDCLNVRTREIGGRCRIEMHNIDILGDLLLYAFVGVVVQDLRKRAHRARRTKERDSVAKRDKCTAKPPDHSMKSTVALGREDGLMSYNEDVHGYSVRDLKLGAVRFLLNTKVGPMEMSFAHRCPNGVIGHNALGSPIGARVVKMERGDGVAHLDGAYAKIDKSLTELAIKAAIGHTFIKTIDSQRVSAPARRVAAIERSPCRGQVVQDEGEERAVRELGHLERQRLPRLAQPLGIEGVTRLHVSLRQGFAHKGRETEIAGGDKVTWLCRRLVSLNEITARDAILIREDEVIGCGRTQSHVEDDGFAKPMVRMPEVANWQEVAERIYHALSL